MVHLVSRLILPTSIVSYLYPAIYPAVVKGGILSLLLLSFSFIHLDLDLECSRQTPDMGYYGHYVGLRISQPGLYRSV